MLLQSINTCGRTIGLEVYALHLPRDLAYIVGVAPINSTLCNTFHHIVVEGSQAVSRSTESRPPNHESRGISGGQGGIGVRRSMGARTV
jgi:hypothetical protein